MRTPTAILLMVAATAPLSVNVHTVRRDSSATSIGLAFGSGTYAEISRGCEGEVLSKASREFNDSGFIVSHEFQGPAVLGLRGTQLKGIPRWDGASSSWIWNPHFSLESESFGIGLGYVSGDDGWLDLYVPPVSGHLRVGNPRSGPAFTLGLFEGVPALSAGGMATMGFDIAPSEQVAFWLGASAGPPYDGIGLGLKCRAKLRSGFALDGSLRFGTSEGVAEQSFAMGLAWTGVHKRTATPVTAAEAEADSLRRALAKPFELR